MGRYRIVVPSKGRPENLLKLDKLLTKYTVVVGEGDKEAYSKIETEGGEIVATPERIRGITPTRNWILNNFNEETIVMIDDDFKGVRCLVGRSTRRYTKREDIQQIIENSMSIAEDLDISLFYWNREPNPMSFLATNPFRFVGGFASSAFGVRGRKLNFDERLKVRGEDVDLTLQALLKDRIIFSDTRFYFDFGAIWGGEGGLQTTRTSLNEDADIGVMYGKWGRNNVDMQTEGRKKKQGVRILYKRKSSLTN